MKRLDAYWEERNPVSLLLLPLSLLFRLVAWLRRQAYGLGLLQIRRLPLPVVVVGNISVGGTGKTPLVVWLAAYLKKRGWRPGIVSRGYGGRSKAWPQLVDSESDAAEVGDEAVLMARCTGSPVSVGPDRVEAAMLLLKGAECDIIVSDDGMQHYALGRDIEIAVIDGERRFGNGFSLPAGPLRERPSRLASVDLIVANGNAGEGEHLMKVEGREAVNMGDPSLRRELDRFAGQKVHALAGIGNPERFFRLLRAQGIEIVERIFPDHHPFAEPDISPDDRLAVLMTEKDAVKCLSFANTRHWFVRAEARLDEAFSKQLELLLKGLKRG